MTAAAAWIVAGRWVHFAAAIVLFGSSLFPVYAPTGRRLDRPLRVAVRTSAGLSLLAALVWLVAIVVDVFGDGGAPIAVIDVRSFFFETSFGRVWIVRLVIMVFAAFVSASLRRNSWTVRAQARVLAAAAAAVLASSAFVGHAAATPGSAARDLALIVQALHLLAVAAWVGGLVPLFIVVAAESRAGNSVLVRQVLTRFSSIGIVAVAVVLASGVFNAVSHLGSFADLTQSGYGRLVTLKAVLFGGLVLLAGCNRFMLVPRLSRSPGQRTILWTIGLECALSLAAIAATAVLGTTAPPR